MLKCENNDLSSIRHWFCEYFWLHRFYRLLENEMRVDNDDKLLFVRHNLGISELPYSSYGNRHNWCHICNGGDWLLHAVP